MTQGIGLFQLVIVEFSKLQCIRVVLQRFVIEITPLVGQSNIKQRFTDTSGIAQFLPALKRLLKICQCLLIIALTRIQRLVIMSLTDQIQSVRNPLFVLSLLGKLLCLQDCRKGQVKVFVCEKIICDEYFSILKYKPHPVTRLHIFNRSEEHTSELQSPYDLVCRLLLE